jgi:anti-sigma regulatory factor (Ser/Thr protein kinase)
LAAKRKHMTLLGAREAFVDVAGVQVKSSTPGWVCLNIAPDLALKDRVVAFLRSQMAQGLSPDLCEELGVAMDELLSNAIEHGCKAEPQCGVELTYIRTPRAVLFQTRDSGPGFSMRRVPHAAVSNPPGEPLRHASFRMRMGLRPGGFGIMLVRQIADELVYNEYGNEVLFIKYL